MLASFRRTSDARIIIPSFFGYYIRQQTVLDDGRQPTGFSSFLDPFIKKESARIPQVVEEPESDYLERDSLIKPLYQNAFK